VLAADPERKNHVKVITTEAFNLFTLLLLRGPPDFADLLDLDARSAHSPSFQDVSLNFILMPYTAGFSCALFRSAPRKSSAAPDLHGSSNGFESIDCDGCTVRRISLMGIRADAFASIICARARGFLSHEESPQRKNIH
jgi:hypothetical protein